MYGGAVPGVSQGEESPARSPPYVSNALDMQSQREAPLVFH